MRRKLFTFTLSAFAFRENPASLFKIWGTQIGVNFNSALGVRNRFWIPALLGQGLGEAAAVISDLLPTTYFLRQWQSFAQCHLSTRPVFAH